jgi:hypothetical protein
MSQERSNVEDPHLIQGAAEKGLLLMMSTLWRLQRARPSHNVPHLSGKSNLNAHKAIPVKFSLLMALKDSLSFGKGNIMH